MLQDKLSLINDNNTLSIYLIVSSIYKKMDFSKMDCKFHIDKNDLIKYFLSFIKSLTRDIIDVRIMSYKIFGI